MSSIDSIDTSTISTLASIKQKTFAEHGILSLMDLTFATFFSTNFQIDVQLIKSESLRTRMIMLYAGFLDQMREWTGNGMFEINNLKGWENRISKHYRKHSSLTAAFKQLLLTDGDIRLGLKLTPHAIRSKQFYALNRREKVVREGTRAVTIETWAITGQAIQESDIKFPEAHPISALDAWNMNDLKEWFDRGAGDVFPISNITSYTWHHPSCYDDNISSLNKVWLTELLSGLTTKNIPMAITKAATPSDYLYQGKLTINTNERQIRRELIVSVTKSLNDLMMSNKPKVWGLKVDGEVLTTNYGHESALPKEELEKLINELALCTTSLIASKMNIQEPTSLQLVLSRRIASTNAYSRKIKKYLGVDIVDQAFKKITIIAPKAEGKSSLIHTIRKYISNLPDYFIEDSDDYGKFLTFIASKYELEGILQISEKKLHLSESDVLQLVKEFYTTDLDQIASYFELVAEGIIKIEIPDIDSRYEASTLQEFRDVLPKIVDVMKEFLVRLSTIPFVNVRMFENGIRMIMLEKGQTTLLNFLHSTLDNSTRQPSNVLVRLNNPYIPESAVISRALSKDQTLQRTLAEIVLMRIYRQSVNHSERSIAPSSILGMLGLGVAIDESGRVHVVEGN